MLKCPKCGTELEYGMTECDFCFRKLTQKELTELERQHFQSDYTSKYAGNFQRKKSKKKLFVILAIAATIIIAAAVSCRLMLHKSIITVAGDGFSTLQSKVFGGGKEETEEDKFLRLEKFAEQLSEQYKDSDYPKGMYPTYDDYLLYLISVNLETTYPDEFTQGSIELSTENGRITEFKWNGWIYVNNNGYIKIYPPD